MGCGQFRRFGFDLDFSVVLGDFFCVVIVVGKCIFEAVIAGKVRKGRV